MDNNPLLVSVIIPVYNGEKYLAEAITNVKHQDYQPLEIIVVDDGSTDGTAEIAAQYRDNIRYIYQENRGPAAARNRGIKMAQGDAIAFLDVDDLWSDNKLKLQADYLTANPSVEIVQGLIQQINYFELNGCSQPELEAISKPYQFINLGSAIYRKSVFEKIGFFDETLKYAEDYDWFLRAWENNVSKIVIEKVMLFYRKHNKNITTGKNLVELGFVKIFKRHLDRCRKQGQSADVSAKLTPISEYIGVAPPNKEVWDLRG